MPHFEKTRDTFCISTNPGRQDVPAVHAYLTRSYWAEGISHDVVEKCMSRSLCFGLFDDQRQIGLARVITDYATFAYLCDVYVLEEYRGRGLGTWLMQEVCEHPELQNLRRFSLVTRDAHSLYRKFGFTALADASRHMEIARPGLYMQTHG